MLEKRVKLKRIGFQNEKLENQKQLQEGCLKPRATIGRRDGSLYG